MKFLLQLKLLMWKNFILRKRQKFRCAVELIWPLSLFLLLMWVRSKGFQTYIHECHFEDKPLPSAGHVLFYQGLLCAFNNTCHNFQNESVRNYTATKSSQFYSLINGMKSYSETVISDFPNYIDTFTVNLNNMVGGLETFNSLFDNKNEMLSSEILQLKNTPGSSLFNISSSTHSNSFVVKNEDSEIQTLKYLAYLNNNLEKSIEKMEPIIKFIDLFETIEKNYNNMTALLKEAVLIDDVLLKFQTFMCGNESSVTLDKLLNRKKSSSFEAVLDRLTNIRTVVQYDYDPESSPACNELYKTLESEKSLQLHWHLLKPFLRGKIVFSPNTPIINRLMLRMKAIIAPPFITRFHFESKTYLFKKQTFSEAADNTVKIQEYLNIAPKLRLSNSNEDALKPVVFVALKNSAMKAESIITRLQDISNRLSNIDYFPMGEASYNFSQLLQCYSPGELEGYPTEEEASKRSMELCEKNTLIAQIHFLNAGNETLEPFTAYKIRMNSDRLPRQYMPFKPGPNDRPYEDLKFITFGFVYMQDTIEKLIVEELTGRNDTPGIILKQMPHPCYIKDWFMSSLTDMFPLFMVLSWVYTCSMIIKSIVYEKELRLKETMRVLGLNNGIHWFGWFIDSIVPMFITSCLLSVVIVFGNVLMQANFTLVLLYFTAYTLATISQSFLISVFFSKANVAAASGGIIFFLGYLPFPFMEYWYNYFDAPKKIVACLLSNVAFGLGSKYFAMREVEGVGANWGNIGQSPIEGDQFSIAIVIGMLLFDSVIYFTLAWYIEGVFPGEFGIPKPWNFPFSKAYWTGKPRYSYHDQRETYDFTPAVECDYFEEEPRHLEKGVIITNLTKVYNTSGKVAVKDLSINFYQDQITAFLGKNGAGKTTTISVLTGLFPPTSGNAYIYGLDINTQMDSIRENLGICPQHNILFGDLTVEEHLWFFARLKGHRPGDVQVEMQQMIEDLGFTDKKHSKTKYLSCGMKRKLSIAIAFIGGSRTVLLDEPTAGVDLYSRHGIWKLLLKYKTGRTVIMTTHVMSEADLIGDRIAIFASGRLLCCGSSSFLKSTLGSGYVLTIDRKTSTQIGVSNDDKAITDPICNLMPGTVVMEKFGTEIKYTLPPISQNIENYTTLFDYLENHKNELGIRSFGIAYSSLEEIFLRMINDCDQLEGKAVTTPTVGGGSNMNAGGFLNEGVETKRRKSSLIKQFMALHIKRFHHTRRNKVALLAELVLPSLFVFLSMWVTNTVPPVEQPSPFEIDVSNCTDCIQFFKVINNSDPSNWTGKYVSGLKSQVGLGIKCVLQDNSNENCIEPVIKNTSNYKPIDDDCSCDTGNFICPPMLVNNVPPAILLANGQEIINVSAENISNWIIRTWPTLGSRRSGGYTFGNDLPLKHINVSDLMDRMQDGNQQRKENPLDTKDNIMVWFNNRWLLSPIAHVNAVNNIILRASVPEDISAKFGIKVINHPMNFTKAQYQSEILLKTASALLNSISIIFAMSFVPASFIMYLIEERSSGSKHLQFISGVHWGLYWIEAFIWDMMCYLLSVVLCVSVFFIFREEAYISKDNFLCIVLLLVLYGWASIPLMYPASFLFSVPSSAFVTLSCVNLFIGITTTASTYILRVFDDEDLNNIEMMLRDIFRIFPHFCLAEGIMKMAENYLIVNSLAVYKMDVELNNLAWSTLGKNMVSMFICGIVFFIALLGIEHSRYREICAERLVSIDPSQHEEDDVDEEKSRVLKGMCDDVLILKYLSKIYKGNKIPAVNQLCLGVKRGECFGLLGMNGAGKTTTFKMLTGDTSITFGEATLLGQSMRNNLLSVRTSIGYCPQVNALDSKLTPKEHLQLYARIRGVPNSLLHQVVLDILRKFDLEQYQDIQSNFLSGGNKRKLSTSLAMVGDPQLIFLDEPTCGMDPKARRFLWDRIKSCLIGGRSVILTTHSMTECEALCSRLTIMVNGKFKCLGSTQHIKNKYGHGYNIDLRAKERNMMAVRDYLKVELPMAVEQVVKFTQMRYTIEMGGLLLSNVLVTLENAKIKGLIYDYSLYQKSLEEIFLQFVQVQSTSEHEIVLCNCFKPCIKFSSNAVPKC